MQETVTGRQGVVAKLTFPDGDTTRKADLLNPAVTKDHLIDLLAKVVAHGFKPLITSVKSDRHEPDNTPALGGPFNHGHTNGFAVDLFVEPSEAKDFIHDCIFNNQRVTKVGLGGDFRKSKINGVGDHFSSASDTAINGVTVFADNETQHIHLQTA